MLSEPERDEQQARAAEIASRRVALGEIGRWYAPWALAVVLVLIFLGGLWTASAAVDDGGFAVGLIGALLALAGLIWELETGLSGRPFALASSLTVDDEVSLLVLIVVLSVMAIGGLILSADGGSAIASGAGYGLALFSIIFIFANLKHYFDVRDSHR